MRTLDIRKNRVGGFLIGARREKCYNKRMKRDDGKDYYTWQMFEKDCGKIAAWAREKGFKNVYGIPRGGLVLAVKLSHLLNVPQILNKEDVTRQTLVVDDIVETGNTAERLFFSLGSKFHLVSLYVGDDPKVRPDFFLHKKKGWIVFPWETDKTSKYDNTLV